MTLLRNRSTPEAAAFWNRAERDEAFDLLRSWLWHNLAVAGALAEATRRGNLAGYAVGKVVGHGDGYDEAERDMRRRRARVDDDED